MAPNSALAFALLGATLFLFNFPSRWRDWTVGFSAAVAGGISLLRLTEYATSWDLAVDQWILSVPSEKLGLAPVGRMGFFTALNFLFASLALVFLSLLLRRRWCVAVAKALSPGVVFIGLAFAFGYLFADPQRPEGEQIPMALNAAVAFVLLGLALCLIIYERDRNERQAVEAERQEAADRIRDLYNNSPCGYHSLNQDGFYVTVNDTELAWLGYTREELVGHKRFSDLITPECRSGFEETFHRFKHQGWIKDLQFEIVRKDGSILPVVLSATAIKDAEGNFVASRSTIFDHTERKRLEAELARARDAALESARLKAEFLANMSHEIRTPMNGVMGMTDLLLDTELDSRQREYASTIRASADALLALLNDILDFSKIEAGKLSFESLDFDLLKVVEDTLGLLAERAQTKGIELAGLVQADVPSGLRGDPGRLRQILTNLISNAIKFTEHGEVIVRVEKLGEDGTRVRLRFEVKDTGIGIPPEAQSRLFSAFSQADSSTTRRFGGTGLGLAISKQLAERMQGEMGFESESGHGSRFWFTAWLEKPDAAPAGFARGTGELANRRVLIVDDNEANRRILIQQTTAWRMRPVSAASGAEALAELRRAASAGDAYDLAILDMLMPAMDGLTLARSIKSEPLIAETRLIVLTSLRDPVDEATLARAGVAASLSKPVKQSQLYDCLVNALGEVRPLDIRIDEASRPSTSSASSPSSRSAGPRILLAEDNPINQKVALGQLQKLGYAADVVSNGKKVLEALRRIPYDIVLMDCQMPELDGYETTRHIRTWSLSQPSSPASQPFIIAMTAHAMQGDREKCLHAGMNDYITKPVQTHELKAALERWNQAGSRASTATALSSRQPPQRHAPERLGDASSTIAPMPWPAEAPPVDLDRLADMCNNDSWQLHELIRLFWAEADRVTNGLTAAIQSGASTEVEQLAHRFRGACSTCGMCPLAVSLENLESAAKAGRMSETRELLGTINGQLEEVRRVVKRRLDLSPEAGPFAANAD
ncbi:MAG: response regulator [Verrucomicrobia bacterium]|nr:response regulator [Verrucomicrobiota bacterium]